MSAPSWMKVAGIYAIRNLANGRTYVGLSVDMGSRWKTHLFQLVNGKHPNSELQDDWNKYGMPAFTYSCIEICDKADLRKRERQLISSMNSLSPNGYNLR